MYTICMQLVYLNYKEPLKEVDGGHGYYGTLAQTEGGDLVQCHICGELHNNLGLHVWFKHGMRANEYREQYQLGRRTPLCSDAWSEKCKRDKIEMWASMTEEEREERKELMRNAERKTNRVGNPRSLEALNKDGMCPDQLISHILRCVESIGKSPTHQEFVEFYGGKYVGAIKRTFGSWNNAKKQANLEPNKPGSRVAWNRGHSRYTDDMLLEYVRNRQAITGTPVSSSDWRKNFLPDLHIYLKRFGSIQKVRELCNNNANQR
jgi:hypothetical protein